VAPRVEVERPPLIENRGGYALIANHQSIFDIPLIGGLLSRKSPKYVANKKLGRWIPSVSLNLRQGGYALIDRGDRIGSVRALRDMAKKAQERAVSVVIFFEGTRSRDGRLGEFRSSGCRAMLKAANELAVVPVAIDGSWKLLAHTPLPVPFGTTITVKLGDPISRFRGDAEAITAAAEAWIAETLAGWRSPLPAPA
jgi:1-acyl-sn-glycerol-3-phosphate acyltransferase